MTTKVEKSVTVNVPVSVAYNQWTQFEEFPHFMGGVKKVTQLSDDRLEWVAEIGGVRRQWEAKILEQIPDRKVSWAATSGATNAGAVTFDDIGGGQTNVHLSLEYQPEGLVEKVGDKLNVIENQAEGDLERFRAFIEDEGYATGAWRGTLDDGLTVGTPGVEDAAASKGDSGKAGVSGKAVAAGVGLAAAAVAASVLGKSDSEDSKEDVPAAPLPPLPTEVATPVVEPAAETTGDYYATPIGTGAGDVTDADTDFVAPSANLDDLRAAEAKDDADVDALRNDDLGTDDRGTDDRGTDDRNRL